MYRRLFFLFPDAKTVKKAVNDLLQEKITTKQMHTLSKSSVNLDGLPLSSPNQQHDMHSKIEYSLWNLNLGIFFVALLVLFASLLLGKQVLMSIALLILVTTYLMGYYYLTKPTVHLKDFHAAFQHNEILLMVDVPKPQVTKIEHLVCHKNPSAQENGTSWTPANFSFSL